MDKTKRLETLNRKFEIHLNTTGNEKKLKETNLEVKLPLDNDKMQAQIKLVLDQEEEEQKIQELQKQIRNKTKEQRGS
eukprot:Pgem_evm1s17887